MTSTFLLQPLHIWAYWIKWSHSLKTDQLPTLKACFKLVKTLNICVGFTDRYCSTLWQQVLTTPIPFFGLGFLGKGKNLEVEMATSGLTDTSFHLSIVPRGSDGPGNHSERIQTLRKYNINQPWAGPEQCIKVMDSVFHLRPPSWYRLGERL